MQAFSRRFALAASAVLAALSTLSPAADTPPSGASAPSPAKVHWHHPAGLVTAQSIAEIQGKLADQEWARRTYAAQKAALAPWLSAPSEKLRQVFPTRRGNVYHNFSCPQDRCRLRFDPFEPDQFKCPLCGKSFSAQTDAGIYAPTDRYHGTMYDGWACLFYETAGAMAAAMGIVGHVEPAAAQECFQRGIEILLLYAGTIERLPTRFDRDPQFSVLLTYHREGDSTVLQDLAVAYELLREAMTPDQRRRFEQVVLQRMLKDIMLERIYTYNHNNLYQWHRTILQTALALEREDLIDWCFGYGAWTPEREPEHRSVRRLLATHFKPDGAYWETCSGYHLYPLDALCQLAVVSRHLADMDSGRFPRAQYDLTAPANPGAQVIRNALEWFMALAMPDRTMPTVGDSMAPRAGMDDYYNTAEVGYRYFDLKAVGDYERFRQGQRSWAALLYGAPEIRQHSLPFTSSCLSSGWVSLRHEWRGNRAWVGLNALVPGGGHQHADRLSLLSYSHGQLLASEKATPYNDSLTRRLGTLSPSHNTVTVDRTSQQKGDTLAAKQVPKVALFFSGPLAAFAELHADQLYPHTRLYRRSVVMIEDLYADFFQVAGGTNHDWVLHQAGAAPRFSVPLGDGIFAPADWLAQGRPMARPAKLDEPWEARWHVGGVTSRLTMLGAPETEVYALETYPVDNAVITPRNPPCQTLCVRRRSDLPFLAISDAWRDQPNLLSVSIGDSGSSLLLQTRSNTWHLCFGPGRTRFADGLDLETDAAFALLRNRDAVLLIHGTRLDVSSSAGTLHVALDAPATLSAECADRIVTFETAGDIHYDTWGGRDHYRAAPAVNVAFSGSLWRVKQQRGISRDAE
ncbi:MAG TPA: heparinase II/III family protein [Verrucomicrobiota bacterium]|nr:heparinase II/III family protein [Verrucomicrobiota bacterium]HQL80155.1 heparinase II/III family protein [Verrucomicrobiota bacterium]